MKVFVSLFYQSATFSMSALLPSSAWRPLSESSRSCFPLRLLTYPPGLARRCEHTQHANMTVRLPVPHDIADVDPPQTSALGNLLRTISRRAKQVVKSVVKKVSAWIGKTYPCNWSGPFDPCFDLEELKTDAKRFFCRIVTSRDLSNLRSVVWLLEASLRVAHDRVLD